MIYPRWYHVLLSLKNWYRYALLSFFLVLTCIVWLLFLYLPLHKEVLDAQTKFHQEQANMDVYAKETETSQRLQKELAQATQEVGCDSQDAGLVLQQGIATLMMELEAAGLTLVALKKETIRKKDWYASMPINIQATGTLQAILDWFVQLEKNSLLVQCDQLTIDQLQKDQYSLVCVLRFFVLETEKNRLKN